MYTILTNHTSEETAYVVDDYPYGFRLRTKIRYWIETRENAGQRFCSQTLNPKTDKWNAAKKSTYSKTILLGLNSENGHVERVDFPDHYDTKIEELEQFYRQYYKFMDLYQLKMFRVEYAVMLAKRVIKPQFEDITIGNLGDYQRAVYKELPVQFEIIKNTGLDNLILNEKYETTNAT